MKTKSLLFGLFTITIFAFGVMVTVLFNTAPTSTDVIVLFFASLLLTLFGGIFFGLFFTNYLRFRATPPWQSTLMSFRWAAIVSALIVLVVSMKTYGLLTLPVIIIIAVALLLFELLWRRRSQTNS